MKAIKHVEKYINKNFPDIEFDSLKKTDGAAKIFTDTEVITISYNIVDKKVIESHKARRKTKNIETIKKDTKLRNKKFKELKTDVNELQSSLKPSDNEKESKAIPKNNISLKQKSLFLEGDLVENIYTGKRYTVINVTHNVLSISDNDATYNTYIVVATDFLKVINN